MRNVKTIKKKAWVADTSSDEEAQMKKKRRSRITDSDSSSDNESNDELPTQVPITSTTRATINSTKHIEEIKSSDHSDSKDDILVEKPTEIKGPPQRGSLRSGINFKDSALNPEGADSTTPSDKLEGYESEWYDKFLTQEDQDDIELSGKLVLLLEVLANAEVVGDKVLVFSQSLCSLDIIEAALGGGNIDGNEMDWCHGVDYFRMDGSTPVHRRKRWSDIFNDPENERYRKHFITRCHGVFLMQIQPNSVYFRLRDS